MDIGKGIQESFDFYRQNFTVLFLATLVTAIISVITVGILAGPLVGGLLLLCLKLMRGEETGIDEAFAHFDKFVPTFLLTVAMWVAMLVAVAISYIPVLGMLVLIIAGPAINIVYMLAIGFAVEKNMPPVAALERAIRCVIADPVMIWLYSFVIGILSGSGAILLIIPVILTMPLGVIGMAFAYRELADRGTDSVIPEQKSI